MLQLQPTKKCGINSCLVSSKNEKMKLKLNVSGGEGEDELIKFFFSITRMASGLTRIHDKFAK